MKLYLAPLQGVTDWVFRDAYYSCIGKFDKAFSPFIRIDNGKYTRPNQCNDIKPEYNKHQKPIPQFLGNNADDFKIFEALCIQQGYSEVNINFGCPYPMVTNKQFGAGILSQPKLVSDFLDKTFSNTKLTISIKCRLGQENSSEFEKLTPIFNNYPIHEIIIHPRVATQMYTGNVELNSFAKYAQQLTAPVCYNGDILHTSDIQKIQEVSPNTTRFMIGRGILQNPFILSEIQGKEYTHEEKTHKLQNFHASLIELCGTKYSGDKSVLKRFTEMWTYHKDAFEGGQKLFKKVKKCQTLAKYEQVIFSEMKNIKQF